MAGNLKLNYDELNKDANIDYEHAIKEVMTNEQYEIFIKYDCIRHFINAFSDNAIISLCLADLKYCFYNSSICRIIDGDKEIILSNDEPSLLMLVVCIENDCKMADLSAIFNLYSTIDDVKIKESIFSCYRGSNNILAIYLCKK